MKRAHGFTMLHMTVALGILAALGATVWGVKAHLEKIRKDGYDAGYKAAMLEVAKRDRKEQDELTTRVTALILERDTKAALHAAEQARLKSNHDKEMAREKGKTADLLDRIRRGDLVLRDPGQPDPGPREPERGGAGGAGGGGEVATAPAAAGGGGQAFGLRLSVPASEFLLREADRADEVAKDLELCWGIARDDRKGK